MGTDAHVIVVDGASDLLAFAERRLRELEAHWTRFSDDSELMRLNARPGVPVVVSPDTYNAIEMAVRAWEHTNGIFDPTIYDAIVATGYDRDFTLMGATPIARHAATVAAPGCGDIHFEPLVSAITLPPGVHLDLGGIGKGLAADLIARELLALGAAGACVNLGGDLSALGTAPADVGWVIELTLPTPDTLDGRTTFAIPEGAVATSSTHSRRWATTEGEVHHLIDAQSGAPVDSPYELVTVLALDAWWAETCAKTIILSGSLGVAEAHGNAGVAFTIDGHAHCFGGFENYLLSPNPHADLPDVER
jgi:thiamine biosynthesis lipoprotein